MASITLTGVLKRPNGELAVGDQIKLEHKSSTGDTVQTAECFVTIPPNGQYSVSIEYGIVNISYKAVTDEVFTNLGKATVNQDNPATNIPELLRATVPQTNQEMLEFQTVLANCIDAQNNADQSLQQIDALTGQQTTTDLINSSVVYDADKALETSGFTTAGDGGGAKWKQNGITGQTPSQSPAQLGDALLNDASGNQWSLIVNDKVNAISLGAIGNGVNNDTASIQAAINYASNNKKITYLPSGVYSIRRQADLYSRGYALLLPPDGSITGDGVEKTILSAFNDGVVYDCIQTDISLNNDNIKLDGFTVFGDHDNRPKGGQGIWLQNASQINIGEIFINEMTGFGIRFQKCFNVFFDKLRVKSTFEQPNDDGIHFYDSSYITGNSVQVSTAGDDCFILTVQNDNCTDVSIKDVVVNSPSGNRGVLMNLSDLADGQHTFRNIDINVVATDCPNGPALLLSGAKFESINARVQSFGCRNGFRVDLSDKGFGSGSLSSSEFNVISRNDIESGVFINQSATINDNKLYATVYNNGDGYACFSLYGDGWQGVLDGNLDPNDDKVDKREVLDSYLTNSRFSIRGVNANKGINLRNTSQNNTFDIVSILNMDSHAVDNPSSASINRFIGGIIDNTVNSPNDNDFYGTKGADAKGNDNLPVDGLGIITIPHGLVQTTGHVVVTYSGNQSYIARHSSSDATNIYIGLFNTSGAPITTGSHRIMWQASI